MSKKMVEKQPKHEETEDSNEEEANGAPLNS